MTEAVEKQRETRFKIHWWGYGAGTLATFAFAQPLMAFVNPSDALNFGFLLGSLISFAYWASIYRQDRDGPFYLGFTILLALLVTWEGWSLVGNAHRNASLNGARCIAIQRDMLSAHRRLVDGPAVFDALGCRPQGEGIIRVPPTDREMRAGKALKDGGYPNR